MLYQLSYFRIWRTGAKINSFPVSAKFFFIKVQYSQRDLNPQNLLPAQQLFLRSLHGLKIETIYHFLHQGRDFIVAKVSDTAFMGMVYLFAVREVSSFNIQSHLLVGIAERHPFTCQAVAIPPFPILLIISYLPPNTLPSKFIFNLSLSLFLLFYNKNFYT